MKYILQVDTNNVHIHLRHVVAVEILTGIAENTEGCTGCNLVINADINGAINIVRKVSPEYIRAE